MLKYIKIWNEELQWTLKEIKIKPDVVDPEDVEMLEDLILTAINEALRKLKRFPLIERFCKKNNGKLELPNCCICQSEIELGKETVLLPCGHMYHWDCCLEWLKTNNTCPMCRFEVK